MATKPGIRLPGWREIPVWLGNVMVFGFMFLLVVGYFGFKIKQANYLFIEDAKAHARLVADIIRLHARSAILARDIMNELLDTFLGNTVKFVEYLEEVEPFDSDELAGFSKEAGLLGITIFRKDGTSAEGPPDWSKGRASGCVGGPALVYHPEIHAFIYRKKVEGEQVNCIAIGINATRIEALQREVSLKKALEMTGNLKEIKYVSLEGVGALAREHVIGSAFSPDLVKVSINQRDSMPVAEVEMRFGKARLKVGLDACPLERLSKRLWRDFFIFSTILAVTGTLLSWILYRKHMLHLEKVKSYERRLASQREEAALGRAAAAIAHEIRNPLNAMSMGLQRLQIEAKELSEEHKKLLKIIQDSLKRTNSTVSGLLSYARLPKPDPKPVRLDAIVEDLLLLYKKKFKDAGIEVTFEKKNSSTIHADPELIGQVIDNLLRNCLEARAQTSYLIIEERIEDDALVLRFRNRASFETPDEVERIFEPYFTTKTRGTGLGLAISKRIVTAHGGKMSGKLLENGDLEITLVLPLHQNQGHE